MGTAEGGQDNSIFEMHSRGLPIIARKMSGAEGSGVAKRPRTHTDALGQSQVARAGGGTSSLSCSWSSQGRRTASGESELFMGGEGLLVLGLGPLHFDLL